MLAVRVTLALVLWKSPKKKSGLEIALYISSTTLSSEWALDAISPFKDIAVELEFPLGYRVKHQSLSRIHITWTASNTLMRAPYPAELLRIL